MSVKSKRLISMMLVLMLTLAVFAGCGPKKEEEPTGFKPGTYEGTAKGFGGDILAKVTLTETAIESIEVTGDSETAGIGDVALEQLPVDMVKRQTSAVDAVTGATVTSAAIIEAVNAALTAAGVDPASLVGIEVTEGELKTETISADVVVIGGGGAGMTAAITAKQAGLNVVLLEKMAMTGGNTVKATGGMNAAETNYQAAAGVEDTIETFISDTMKGGYDLNNLELVTVLAENSAEGVEWLETIGAPLPLISSSGGATNKRIHAPEDGSAVGPYILDAMNKKMAELEIPVYLNTKANELITDESGAVVGVKATGSDTAYTFEAKVVILATGGFGANEDMYAGYKPELKGFVTTNAPGATGDGIIMAEAVGAALVDIEQIQTHPTVEQSTSIMVTESVRSNGAILVNQQGERFGDEMSTRDVVSAAVISQEGGYAYALFDQRLRDNLKAVESYVSNGIVVEAATLAELAATLEIDADTLAATVESWNKAVADQNDEAFGRTGGMEHPIGDGPYYAIKIAPGIHHTMGGVRINTQTQVLTADGEVIPGLLACGEVTGGVHGGNRLGGNAVADIVVFGRIAGQTAVETIGA